MPIEKTTGIVLKVVDFSETSCVVTLYTRDFGKVTALAKGARRLRSPFEGAIDLLACCRIVFLRKSVDKLDLLTEAKLQRRFRSASTDLSRFYVGLYVIELVSLLTDPAESQPELFDLVSTTLQDIDTDPSPTLLTVELLAFELKLLAMLGHQPSLFDCVGCGKPIAPLSDNQSSNQSSDQMPGNRKRVPFGMLVGGVYCQACRAGKRSVVGLQPETLQLMRQLSDSQADHREIECDVASRGELRGLLDQYVADLVGFRPKMQPWLKETFRE